MLPTFVIGLREGLEAALIVGIIAAFLRKQGRSDLLRQMAIGVAAAVTICALGGLALEVYSRNLPQRQQEGLETVIGILAVGMVTYMVIWMKEHARGLRGELESMAADALGGGTGRAGTAMVVMAGLAVLREGFETVVFLLAAFNESGSGAGAAIGAVSGIALSVALGYGIYRGGVRINLSKFFRATGLVLVLVAGGLVVTALHTAHEAGWFDAGQYRLLDLSWLVRPGSVLASLLTGMLGIQPFPVLAEVLGWLIYVIPVGVFVAWPPGRAVPLRALRAGLADGAVLGLGLAAVLAATLPTPRPSAPVTGATVVALRGNDLILSTPSRAPLEGTAGKARTFALTHTGSSELAGLAVETYATSFTTTGTGPPTISVTDLARLNDGRLPLGVRSTQDELAARYRDTLALTASVDPQSAEVLGLTWKQSRYVVVTGTAGQQISTANPLTSVTHPLPRATASAALAHARDVASVESSRERDRALAWLVGILGAASAAGLGLSFGRRRTPDARSPDPAQVLVSS